MTIKNEYDILALLLDNLAAKYGVIPKFGSRGIPAKDVGWVTGARVRIPLTPPIGIKVELRQKDIQYVFVDGVAGLIAYRERKQIDYTNY